MIGRLPAARWRSAGGFEWTNSLAWRPCGVLLAGPVAPLCMLIPLKSVINLFSFALAGSFVWRDIDKKRACERARESDKLNGTWPKGSEVSLSLSNPIFGSLWEGHLT